MVKRILLISYHTCPLASDEGKETGGMNVYVLELGKQLAKMGYFVDAITRSQGEKEAKIVKVAKNFRVIHLTAGAEKPLSKRVLPSFIPNFVASFLKFAAREKITYDVIDAHYFQSGLAALEINKKMPKKLPLVMTFHTLSLMKNLVARTRAEQESQFRIDAEFTLTRQADAIVSPSSNDKQYMQYLYHVPPQKIYEIPPGVNLNIFKPADQRLAKNRIGAPAEEKMILFVGRVEPLKGIDTLLYAFRIINVKNPTLPIGLWIVGGDISQHLRRRRVGLLAQLDHLGKTLHLATNIHFVGKKPQKDLPDYYNAADLVVLPSHYESFGMVAAEAMAAGTPVITTNVTGISSLIDEKRKTLITSVNNPLLLASQIISLLTDKKLYSGIRKNLAHHVADLGWDTVGKLRTSLYAKLVR